MASAAIDLAAHLSAERVAFLRGSPTKRDALLTLAEIAAATWAPQRRAGLLAALLDREQVATTAIGHGIAVPHARLPGLERPLLCLGLAPGGIDWQASDQAPVDILLLIIAREEDPTGHLLLLAGATRILGRPEARQRLLQSGSAAEAINALR